MLKLYTDFLDHDRLVIWQKLGVFSNLGVLGGGTALTMQLNHRVSYDFDIFTETSISKRLVFKLREVFGELNIKVLVDSGDELTVLYGDQIKISFIYFPFRAISEKIQTKSLSIFGIKDLLANKAYALGRRGAWRDYADIFWSLKNKVGDLKTIIEDTKKKFGGLFNEKLFLEQLVYFEDVDERIIEWIDNNYSNKEIEKILKEEVKNYFEGYNL